MASTNINMLGKTGNNKNSDECYTPESAILPLLEFLDKNRTYYEATSIASSSIVDCLIANGFKCKKAKGDFFEQDEVYDGVITNPPYSIKDKFIEACYETEKPFALLLPVSAIQGIKRGKMFEDKGIELLVLNKRVDFTGKGSPHFGVAWFCYKLLPSPLIFK